MSTNITIPVPAVPFAPPVYTCHRAKKPFELDGNINKPFWEDAPYTDEFLDIEGSHMPLPRFVTRAKMLWDDENLYVAAVLDGDEIWGHQTERDSVIFLDNDFEIASNKRIKVYSHISGNRPNDLLVCKVASNRRNAGGIVAGRNDARQTLRRTDADIAAHDR